MGLIHIMERGGDDWRDYKKALHMAKAGIERLCELTDEMEEQYGGDMDERHDGYSMRGGYYRRGDMEGMYERKGRDSRGRYI